MSARVLVLGLGNELVGDDAFGPLVLERLYQDPELASSADLQLVRTDLLGQMDLFNDRAEVVLIDAILDPEHAGQVRIVEEAEFSAWEADSPSGHQISPILTVRLFRTLSPGAATRFRLVGLCVDTVTQGRPRLCTPKTLDEAADAVRRLAHEASDT